MGKIYLVDSENVGDIWVPLLVSSQEDDEVLVFYTTKSPHMNYENVRMLKETEKEADFIKCFEGSNALDFQLVSELGYRLSQNADREYVIVSNDTGFDAAVRYWSTRKMPVSRLSGKECHRMLTEKKQRVAKESGVAVEPEQEQTRAAGPEVETEQVRESGSEAEAEQVRETGQEAEAERGREQSKKPRSSKKSEPSKAGGKAGESGNPEASGKVGNAEESGKAEPAENAGLAEESGKAEPAENAGLAGESGKPEVTGKAEDAEESGKPEVTGKAEDAETSGKSESAEKAGLAEESGKAEPAEKTGRAKRSRKSAKAEKSERMSEPDRSEKSQKSDKAKTQNAGNEKPDLTEEQSGQMTEMMDLKEEMSENPQSVSNATDQSEAPVKFGLDLNAERAILKTLCACISKENLVDFHNALVALLGEEEGKRLYQELKTNAEYASYWSELPAYGLKEKFDMYCKMVFDHSEYAKEPPEDFSGFLYQANGKRKNLNSLRAALQGHYGKDKGMKYYSLFKSHIKMMNRM
ncbi:PIN domain-containing protein [Roseburia hominis]